MKKIIGSLVRRLFREQHGQALLWTAAGMTAILGIGGLLIDVGHAYVVRGDLQNYANAAALAAAGEVYDTESTGGATTTAIDYSAIGKGDENYNSILGPVNTTIVTWCLNALMPSGETCSKSSPANALKVTETASVPTFLMRVLGFKTMTVAATATATMQGAAQPWNVAIVLDSTGSMSSAPPTGSCTTNTEFACALGGVQTLLQNVPNPNGDFHVALFAFPNVTTASVSDDWTCGGTPQNEPYTFPVTNLADYTPLDYFATSALTGTPTEPKSTYEVTPVGTSDGDANGFVTDYYSASSKNYLSSGSSIVKEVGGCMKNPGGENTYYAGVIYAAEAALEAEQKLNPGSKNAMIVLSDGQANQTDSSHLASGYAGPTTGIGLSLISAPTSSTGYYPSLTDQCQQAIMAAQSAQAAGTTVYAVAFGSESSGCGDGGTVVDKTSIANYTGTSNNITVSTLTPCVTMKNMATPPITTTTATGTNTITYFYADSSSASNGCTDSAHTVTTISDIFGAISTDFTTPRLLPNSSGGVAISTTTN